jgi:hypothetical protein
MIQLLNPGGDCLTQTTLKELRDPKDKATDAFWIDLLNPEPEEEQFIEKTLEVNIPSRGGNGRTRSIEPPFLRRRNHLSFRLAVII